MLSKYLCKTIPIFFILVLTSTISNAQIKIGLAGGANFASYTISDKAPNTDLTHKLGISIGAMAEYNLTEKLATRISIKYVQRGGENEIAFSGRNVQNKIFYNYLELSPYLKYRLINTVIPVKIIGGLSLGYLLNAKAESMGNQIDIKDDFKLFNISGDLGIGTEISLMEKTSLLINGLYSYGLTNISKNVGSMETRDISIYVGFLYKL